MQNIVVPLNPYWQISETKSKNWVRHRASFSQTKSLLMTSMWMIQKTESGRTKGLNVGGLE